MRRGTTGSRAEPRSRIATAVLCGALLAMAALSATVARAHNVGDSYLYLQVYENTITGRFEIALVDLNPALGLSGTEMEITAENLDQRIGFLQQYYLEHVEISDDQGPLEIVFRDHDLLGAGGGYVLMPFDLEGLSGVPDRLTFDYSVLFEEEPSHRGFLLVEHNWATGTFANENQISLAFSPMAQRQEFDLTSTGRLRGFVALARLGAEHMLLGLDHLLFLIALLLPTVLLREGGRWQPVERLQPTLRQMARVVSAVVVAHAVALTLAAMGIVPFPEALVETVIAGSIVLAALHLWIPVFRGPVWWTIFALAIFHGYGFASSLLDMGVLEDHMALSLLAFFLGVEAGQIAVVAVLFPLMYLFRRLWIYRRVALPAAALGMILLAGVWVVERGFGVDVPLRESLPSALQKVIP